MQQPQIQGPYQYDSLHHPSSGATALDIDNDVPVCINSSPRSPRKARSGTVQSQTSQTSFGGISLFGSEANPRDMQELLDNLDRATNLIRKHFQSEEKLERDHV